jgi:hypothetical protein
MILQHRAFRRSKGTGPLDQCEDAFAVNPDTGRFAVADGATESGFADIWARLLVEQFASSDEGDLAPWDAAWINAVRKAWLDEVRELLVTNFGEHELPWYVENSLRRGALATFLGLVVSARENDYRWRATAIGDTCLFHTRHGELLRHMPIERANQFNNTPLLMPSYAEGDDPQGVPVEDVGQPDDRLWLATDALAAWCLEEHEANRNPWRKLEWLLQPTGTDERFSLWIDRLRSNRRLRNDDVTLVVVTL